MKDLSRKDEAIEIDTNCFKLDNTSHEIGIHPGINMVSLRSPGINTVSEAAKKIMLYH